MTVIFLCEAKALSNTAGTIDLMRFKMIENEMDLHGTKFLNI